MSLESALPSFDVVQKPTTDYLYRECGISTVSAEQIFRDAFPDMDEDRLCVKRDSINMRKFKIYYCGQRTPTLPFEYKDEFEIDFNRNEVLAGDMMNNRGDRKTGRLMFAWRCVLGLLLGMDRVRVKAGDEMGGYIWAKAGVRANPTRLQDQFDRLDYLKESALMSAVDYNQAHTYLHNKNSDDLWHLTRMDVTIDAAHCPFIKQTTKNKFFKSGQLTLGQALLADSGFIGYVDLQDDAQLGRISDYCGLDIAGTSRKLHRTMSAPSAGHSSPPSGQAPT